MTVFTFQVWSNGRPLFRRKTILNELKIELKAMELQIDKVERMPLQERYAFDARVYTKRLDDKLYPTEKAINHWIHFTTAEWERLPLRTRVLINSGMAEEAVQVKLWRRYWKELAKSYESIHLSS